MREFHGKVAFVTGGASGVGFALARAFGRANMRVMLADIEAGALNSAVTKLKSEGIDAHGVQCDVADRASVQRAAAETIAAFEKVHVVCSNAGVGCGGPLELITPGDWDWVIGVNLMGFVHVIQAFLPHHKGARRGWPNRNDGVPGGNGLSAWYGSLQCRQIWQCSGCGNARRGTCRNDNRRERDPFGQCANPDSGQRPQSLRALRSVDARLPRPRRSNLPPMFV